MKFFRQLNIKIILGIAALLATVSYAEEYQKILHSAKLIKDVRIEVVSVDNEGKGELRISGQDCQYCDREFWFDESTKMMTPDYIGRIDNALMQTMVFAKGSVRFDTTSNRVSEVRYVELQQ